MPPCADVLKWEHLPFPKSLPSFQKLFPDDAACARYYTTDDSTRHSYTVQYADNSVTRNDGFVCNGVGGFVWREPSNWKLT